MFMIEEIIKNVWGISVYDSYKPFHGKFDIKLTSLTSVSNVVRENTVPKTRKKIKSIFTL